MLDNIGLELFTNNGTIDNLPENATHSGLVYLKAACKTLGVFGMMFMLAQEGDQWEHILKNIRKVPVENLDQLGEEARSIRGRRIKNWNEYD